TVEHAVRRWCTARLRGPTPEGMPRIARQSWHGGPTGGRPCLHPGGFACATAMTLAILASRALCGAEAPAVRVETHLGPGLPAFTVVGLPDTEVRESRERVRAAILNSGF